MKLNQSGESDSKTETEDLDIIDMHIPYYHGAAKGHEVMIETMLSKPSKMSWMPLIAQPLPQTLHQMMKIRTSTANDFT